jgi:glycosyltransferase involved in cell wall biosynthesis
VAEYLSIVARYADRRIVVFRPVVDWISAISAAATNRPELARQGFLYFIARPILAATPFSVFEIAQGLVLTDQYLLLLNHLPNKIWHLYSTDLTCDVAFAEARMANGDSLLYEYIDELHADISGQIPASALVRHHAFLADERIPLVTSADKLANEARKVRRRNHLLATNGVEIEHFATKRGDFPVPAEIQAVVTRGKPIIGYFGALAKWFDYALVIALARARPDLEILLIGWDYDGSLKAHDWTSVPNVSIVGPIRYELLPRFACWFDVATIPFLVNDITESTSPIKLFEYMAMDCPIVTTDLPECRKYASTLIGRDHRQFIERVDEALARRGDPAYHATLANEAARNSWAGKARELVRWCIDERAPVRFWTISRTRSRRTTAKTMRSATVPQYERCYRREERYYWYPVLNWIDRLDSVNRIIDVGGAYGTLLLYAKRRHGSPADRPHRPGALRITLHGAQGRHRLYRSISNVR